MPLPDFDAKTNNVINEICVNISEIVDILKLIDPYEVSGPGKISHKMLKIFPQKIAIPLQIIYNKSLRQCPLVRKMHMSRRFFFRKVILLYLLITAQYH